MRVALCSALMAIVSAPLANLFPRFTARPAPFHVEQQTEEEEEYVREQERYEREAREAQNQF